MPTNMQQPDAKVKAIKTSPSFDDYKRNIENRKGKDDEREDNGNSEPSSGSSGNSSTSTSSSTTTSNGTTTSKSTSTSKSSKSSKSSNKRSKSSSSRTSTKASQTGEDATDAADAPDAVPSVSSSKVGNGEHLVTPEEHKEAQERVLRESERYESDDNDREVYDSDVATQRHISLLSLLATIKSLRGGLLFVIGRVLRFILHLDMHGGNTGSNVNFVEGLIDFLGGSMGGAAQVYVSQPLDTVKVKLQTFPEVYNGMLDCFVKTYRKDGFMHGLYAGSVPAVFANVAENSVLFAAYGGCQKVVSYIVGKEKASDLSTWENAWAGSLAACFSTLTLCPTELIKVKLQALREMKNFVEPGMDKLRTPWSLTRYIWRTEGIRGFYRGLSSTFIREMPGYFFFFGSYEGTRELLRKPNQTKDEIGPLYTMIAGGIGGVCLWTSTFPADVIKSRIQVKNLNQGMITVGADIIRREGFAALYRGLLPSVLRTIPATATLFVVYEYTKKALHGTL